MKNKIVKIIIVIALALSYYFITGEKRELFRITDFNIATLDSVYGGYTYEEAMEDIRTTPNKKYKIYSIGRTVSVKLEKAASSSDYKDLLKTFKEHYEDNEKVKSIYTVNDTLIMIDCNY